MEIRIRDSGEIINDSKFREMHPTTPFPYLLTDEIVNTYNADIIQESQIPTCTLTQVALRNGVEQIDGIWYTKYTIYEKNPELLVMEKTVQSNNMRSDRNMLLVMCDWTQLADSKVDKEAWATYRQQLRDITLQEGFPWSVEWPAKPI